MVHDSVVLISIVTLFRFIKVKVGVTGFIYKFGTPQVKKGEVFLKNANLYSVILECYVLILLLLK